VVVTASHNPPEYNGYKVYWGNGAQISEPHDRNIAAEIARGPGASGIELSSPQEARRLGLWHDIGPEIGRSYLDRILGLRRHPGAGTDLEIVYTALHGVGGEWTTRALAEAGFRNLTVVANQHAPDPGFPTVRFPNPEEPGALDLARVLAEERRADLLLANDPDADRLAVGVRTRDGGLRTLSGDEVGILLGHYVLTQTRPLPPRPLVMTTIVSSAQLGRIARELGAAYEETLTGFRWLCNRAMALEREQQASFLFGYEEALGYVVGPAVRDKDGVGAALVFADLAGWCRSQDLTVPDYLEQIQRRHGLYLSAQRSFRFSGPEGVTTIARVMQGFRERPPEGIAGLEVVLVKDYQEGVAVARGRDTESRLELPAANVMGFELAGGSRVMVRPSGTEPKIKYYFELGERAGKDESLAAASARGKLRLQELITGFLALAAERGQPS
jgi:phosphomannomutase